MTQLTFGKHKGHSLEEIPLSYLVWLQDAGIREAKLRAAVAEVVKQRQAAGESPFDDGPRAEHHHQTSKDGEIATALRLAESLVTTLRRMQERRKTGAS